jgi:hypothetical protein
MVGFHAGGPAIRRYGDAGVSVCAYCASGCEFPLALPDELERSFARLPADFLRATAK